MMLASRAKPELTKGAVRQQFSVPSIASARRGRALLALSLANMCFLSAWQRRIYGIPFFMPLWAWQDLGALAFNIVALAACFYLVLGGVERLKGRVNRLNGLIYALPLLPIVNLARRAIFPFHHGKDTAIIMTAIPSLFVLGMIAWQRKLLRAVEFVIVGLSLLLVLNIAEMARIIRASGVAPPLAAKIKAPATGRVRVVWLVFDEMDFGLSFPRRPPQIRLPEFDRLRSESLFATAAYQPGPGTEMAMPTLITGKVVYHAKEAGADKLLVNFSPQGSPVDWAEMDNVFSDARAAHLNAGVVGWYLPYCRLLHSSITDCDWESIYSIVHDRPSFWTSVLDQLDATTPVESRVRGMQRLDSMISVAERMALDRDLSLVLIHLPIPHGPPIYDRGRFRTTPFDLRKDWFFDNVLLADRVLGKIRLAMQDAGQWNDSVIIVTSDHSLRQFMMPHPHPTPLVPFMVKMRRQMAGTDFDVPFNTVITRELIKAVLGSEVTKETLPAWLQEHAAGTVPTEDLSAQ